MIGALERKTRRFICRVIGNTRNTEVVRNFIEQCVSTTPHRKTLIYSDGAYFYSFLSQSNYAHTVVVHERSFGRGEETTN